VFNNNPQGSRLRGQPQNRWWNCVQTDINRCQIKNWNEWSKNRADWEKSVKGAKVAFDCSDICEEEEAPGAKYSGKLLF
jgi:hypothetical protein